MKHKFYRNMDKHNINSDKASKAGMQPEIEDNNVEVNDVRLPSLSN